MRRSIFVLAALMIASLLVAAPAVADSEDAQLTVVHGIPEATVDVYVNGAKTLPDFAPGSITEPLALAAGDYTVDIYAAGAGPADVPHSAAPIVSAMLNLSAGSNVSAIANLDAMGAPAINAFVNDVSEIAADEGRLVVRHTAFAPSVDVIANEALTLFAGVTNPNEGQMDVAAGTYGVTLNAAGTDTVAFDAGDLEIPEGKSTIVYAIGDLAGGSFGLLVQSIDLPIAPTPNSYLTVVHGIPEVTVDVYVNGAKAIPGFAPNTVTDPIGLPSGMIDVEIYLAGEGPEVAASPVLSGEIFMPPGGNVSAVAHLTDTGGLALSAFLNDTSQLAPNDARLVVRHLANAPAVDVIANEALTLFAGVTNPNEGQLDVAAGTYGVTINAAGTDTVAFDAGDLTLPEGQSTIVYAVGDLAGGSFTLLIQAIPNLGPDGWFDDDNGSVHQGNINLIASLGITKGTGDGTFSPEESVTRGQMAAFIRRALNLPASATDFFADDDESIFEGDINAIAAAGITVGTGEGTYSPDEIVTRGQMAAFLQRAFNVPSSNIDAFGDDDGTLFEGNINAIAAAGITVGTGEGTYSPNAPVTRAQMATFLARALGIGS